MSFSASRQSVGDDYFNDLSQQQQQPPPIQQDNPPRLERSESSGDRENGETLPRPKRIACILCRKRKLKCDGAKPSCSTCSRLKHDCAYDEARKKSGPKRGYVKALEARLAQVETLLKTQDSSETVTSASGPTYQDITPNEPMETTPDRPDFFVHNPRRSTPQESQDQFNQPFTDQTSLGLLDDRNFDLTSGGGSPWELMSLGLDEALPPQEVIDELHNIYFGKIHMSVPMVHRARYLAALNLAPHLRPPVCLRYAIWCIAASISEKYNNLSEIFYLRARRYAEYDQMKGHGEGILTVAHAQCWILIATYEFKLMYFPRAWLSVGKGGRMCQMMGLHRLDGKGLDVKQCLLPPRDWTEREERRRTFWMAFCEDRYASIGTGWPVLFEEKDILTNLPASEESYQMSRATSSKSLPSALDPSGAASLSSFAGVVVLACLFGRNLIHLHRPDDGDNDEDLNGPFWKRHRNMDNILLNTALSLPGHLRLPAGIADPNIIFLNMNIHTSTICLHQAAIFKADKNRMPAAVSAESKMRCLTAAAEIASIMRTVSHTDLSAMNPFMSFCLYVSARVFVQYLKARPEDEQFVASLRFLLSAMNVIKRQNPLTESFLAQLEVDLEAAGMDIRSGGDRVSVTRSPTGPGGVKFQPSQGLPQGIPIYQSGGADASCIAPETTNNSSQLDETYSRIHPLPGQGQKSSFSLPNRYKDNAAPGASIGLCGPVPKYPSSNSSNQQGSSTKDSPMTMDTSDDRAESAQSDTLSPSASAHRDSSSHTSYTPPDVDDVVHRPLGSSSSTTAMPAQAPAALSSKPVSAPSAFESGFSFESFSPGQFLPPTPGREDGSGFVIPPGWDIGGQGMTPGPVTDMSTSAEGAWTQMLEGIGMGWGGAGIAGNPA